MVFIRGLLFFACNSFNNRLRERRRNLSWFIFVTSASLNSEISCRVKTHLLVTVSQVQQTRIQISTDFLHPKIVTVQFAFAYLWQFFQHYTRKTRQNAWTIWLTLCLRNTPITRIPAPRQYFLQTPSCTLISTGPTRFISVFKIWTIYRVCIFFWIICGLVWLGGIIQIIWSRDIIFDVSGPHYLKHADGCRWVPFSPQTDPPAPHKQFDMI